MTYNTEEYWNRVAENIKSRQDVKVIAGDDEPYYRYKRRRFLEILGTIDFMGKSVLEIGCGPGGNIEFLLGKNCSRIAGVDISNKMISIAKETLKGKPVELIKIDGVNLPFKNYEFDVVFTSTVLQHNTNEVELKKLVVELCRVANNEVLLFERIENRIKGHESNLGRPISYYQSLMIENGFKLVSTQALPIQVSYFFCGAIRRLLNGKSRQEGEPLSKISIILEKVVLPLSSLADKIVPSKRDTMLLRFKRATVGK